MKKKTLKKKLKKLNTKLTLVQSDLLVRAEMAEYDAKFANQALNSLKLRYKELQEKLVATEEEQLVSSLTQLEDSNVASDVKHQPT